MARPEGAGEDSAGTVASKAGIVVATGVRAGTGVGAGVSTEGGVSAGTCVAWTGAGAGPPPVGPLGAGAGAGAGAPEHSRPTLPVPALTLQPEIGPLGSGVTSKLALLGLGPANDPAVVAKLRKYDPGVSIVRSV